MKAFGNLLGVVLGLALLVGFLAGGYYLFNYIVNVFGTLEPQLKTITAIASVVALLCATIIAGGLKARSQKEITSSLIVEKANIYLQLLSLWSKQLNNSLGGEKWPENVELTHLEQLLALYGGSKVITAYVNLRRLVGQELKAGDEVPTLLNTLVTEMRGDLGYTESNLNENDLLDLLLGRG